LAAACSVPRRTITWDGPRSPLAIADLDGNGRLDLAAATYTGVAVLLGQSGGGLGPPTSYGAGPNPAAVAIGDFNGDGHIDLAVADAGFDFGPTRSRCC